MATINDAELNLKLEEKSKEVVLKGNVPVALFKDSVILDMEEESGAIADVTDSSYFCSLIAVPSASGSNHGRLVPSPPIRFFPYH